MGVAENPSPLPASDDATSSAPMPAATAIDPDDSFDAADATRRRAAAPMTETTLDGGVWKLLAEIAMAASGEEDLERILFTSLDRLAAHVPFTGGSIALVDDDELVVHAAVGPFADEALGQRLPRGTSRSWRVVESAEPFVSGDLRADGLSINTPRAGARLRSWLAVPLVRDGKGIGLLEVDSTEPDAFDGDDLALLERVALALSRPVEIASRHQLEARALAENRDLLDRLGARERQQAAVASLGQAALAGAALDTLFEETAQSVSHTLGVDIVTIIELDRGERSLRLAAAAGMPEGAIGTSQPFERERDALPPLIERAFASAGPVIVEYGAAAATRDIWPPTEPEAVASAACVPIGALGRRSGVLCACSRQARPFRDDDVNFLLAVSNVLATAVERHRVEAREATARNLRNAFVGVISHELRTPITTIYGSSKLLQRPASSMSEETRAQVLADIEAEADRLRRLVEDLLVLSRAEGGRLDVSDEPILIGHVVRRAADAERVRYPAWHFIVDVAPDLPASMGEETAVEQVVRNLVTNAAKYSTPGSTIRVTAEAAGDEVIVRVLDEGVGIVPGETERLFELFYRSPSAAQRASGAGIGLFVCRQLVEAMGGRIWARPRPTGGSEFGFALPVQHVDEFA